MSNSEDVERIIREAEEIVKEAYASARAESCPQGAECPVHFRVDEEYFLPEHKYARLITYVGEYVVITEDNQELSNPATIVRAALGLMTKPPHRWETAVYHVGDGPFADIMELGMEEFRKTLRHRRTHDEWDMIKPRHAVVVELINLNEIDLSKPWEG